MITHLDTAVLEAGLDHIRQAPQRKGTLQLILRRPAVEARELLDTAELDLQVGLVGDNWQARGSKRTADGSAHPDMQITLMNSRAAHLMAQTEERWQLAGDQLYVDFDLSVDNLPPGTQLSVGTAVLEITAQPHNGCKKFAQRFGRDAVIFVNSVVGKQLRLRGVNAKVIRSGRINKGDMVTKL